MNFTNFYQNSQILTWLSYASKETFLQWNDESLRKKQILNSYDILPKLLIKKDPSQFNLGVEYDGTHNSNMRMITIKEYLGRYPIEYLKVGE